LKSLVFNLRLNDGSEGADVTSAGDVGDGKNNDKKYVHHISLLAWNDLPIHVLNALSLLSFTNLLKSYSLDRFVTIIKLKFNDLGLP